MVERFKASGIHFALSASVIAVFLCLVFFIWYPAPFDQIYSTWDVIKIVAGVDVVMGPLLTLVVFNSQKKITELRRDLSIIVILQLVALGWGVNVTYSARPAFLVFSNGTFYSFSKSDVDVSKLNHKELEPALFESPVMVYLKPPKDAQESRKILMEVVDRVAPELIYRTSRYRPASDHMQRVLRFSLDINEISKNEKSVKLINQFVEEHSGELNDYAFYRLRGGKTYATMVLNKTTGDIAGLINDVL